MGHTAILLALFASNLAQAGTRIDKYTGSIGDVTLEGSVEVTLYSTPNGGRSPAVQVMIGDHSYLFWLSTASDYIYINDDVVKAEELKAHEGNKKFLNLKGKDAKWALGEKREWVRIDEMRIGDMVLTDVISSTTDPNADKKKTDFFHQRIKGDTPAGIIGLSALPDWVSWSIRPSTGTVSFATGDAVAGLNALEGGTTMPYRTAESFEGKWGKDKYIRDTNDLVVAGTVGGQPADVVLSALSSYPNYDSRIDVGDAMLFQQGDRDFRYLTVTAGDLDLGTHWMLTQSSYSYVDVDFQAGVGAAWLADFDISVDRPARTVTLAPSHMQNRHDPLPFLIEAAKARVAPEEPGEGEGEGEEVGEGEEAATADASEDPDAADEPPGTPGAWSDLGDLYEATGDYDSAIEARTNTVRFNEHVCTSYLGLGRTQLEAGKVADAIVSLEKASTLYHDWYGFPLDDRKEKEKALSKLDDDEKKASDDHPADSSCHKADGDLAGALLAAGDFETVALLYAERLDLDPDLAQIAANTLIAQGHYKAAHAPLRQVAKMSRRVRDTTGLGLAMVYAQAGDWYTAQGHFERILHGGSDTMTVEIWLESLRAAVSPQAAVKAAQEFVRKNPTDSAAYFGLAREAALSGEEESIAGAQALGDAFFAGEIERYPRSGWRWADYARYLVVWGRHDEAQTAAELALQFSPGNASAWMAMADVQSAKGNVDRAQKLKLRAAQVATGHPGYARFFGQYRN